ncbi:hypothetical protein [Streptomyces sp. enrichment culture]|uniref:hypothetical protein n=1 Tax=Streptomyces sp. enrichment culture TaxID=1795815 RepID=UPI003F560FB9
MAVAAGEEAAVIDHEHAAAVGVGGVDEHLDGPLGVGQDVGVVGGGVEGGVVQQAGAVAAGGEGDAYPVTVVGPVAFVEGVDPLGRIPARSMARAKPTLCSRKWSRKTSAHLSKAGAGVL